MNESTCPEGGGDVGNADFGLGTEGWNARYGRISTTDATFTSPPGSLVLVTSESRDSGSSYQGVTGQCVAWDAAGGATSITVEAYLQGDPDILTLGSSAFFHAASSCRGEILEVLNLPAGTNSIDLVVWATGARATTAAAIDDFCAHP